MSFFVSFLSALRGESFSVNMSDDEIPLKPNRLRTHPHTTRSRLMLEVASQLVNRKDFPYLQARVQLREQGSVEWPLTLFASDSPATIHEVAAGNVQFAIVNPSMILKIAALGSAPFTEPMSLRGRCGGRPVLWLVF